MASHGNSAPTEGHVLRPESPPAARDIRDTLVIKEQDLFLLTDLEGNVPRGGPNGLGLYLADTRFLSALELAIEGLSPTILLSAGRSHFLASQVLTNPNLVTRDGQLVHEQTIQVRRHRMLQPREVRESLFFENFNLFPLRLQVAIHVEADFADMFEIRGLVEEPRRGQALPPAYRDGQLTFAYEGADGVRRTTVLRFEPEPTVFSDGTARFEIPLSPRGKHKLDITVAVDEDEAQPGRSAPRPPRVGRGWSSAPVQVHTSNKLFDAAFTRSRRDLRMLVSGEGDESFISAGTPWYATLFGRDTLIAALQDLWVSPQAARQTLRLLARHQGRRRDPWRDEEPGKILHELRRGEVARCDLVPFNPYFGTVDATPLWVVLLGEYHRCTGDLELVRELRPNLEAALRWMDEFGDQDGDGFVEYHSESRSGLVNQGWKDSWDGIVHTDGSLARSPIALVEVQAYVFAAKRAAAALFSALDEPDRALDLEAQATSLAQAFEDAFWMPEARTYCLALDADKRQVGTVASNAGHVLWSGIATPERGRQVARRLMEEDMFSGWGIRTLSSREARYNPAGYHLGTVWPHDNSLIALGLANYGQNELLLRLVTGMMDAVRHFPQQRMPELFCGYARSAFDVPVRYPVACSPQAWAAASWSAFLQAMLGLHIDAPSRELRIEGPVLPRWLDWVCLRDVRVGDGSVDLRYDRVRNRAAVDVLRMRGDVHVTIARLHEGG